MSVLFFFYFCFFFLLFHLQLHHTVIHPYTPRQTTFPFFALFHLPAHTFASSSSTPRSMPRMTLTRTNFAIYKQITPLPDILSDRLVSDTIFFSLPFTPSWKLLFFLTPLSFSPLDPPAHVCTYASLSLSLSLSLPLSPVIHPSNDSTAGEGAGNSFATLQESIYPFSLNEWKFHYYLHLTFLSRYSTYSPRSEFDCWEGKNTRGQI